MKSLSRYSLYFLFLFFVVSCKQNQETEITDIQVTLVPSSTQAPYVFATSKPSTASIHSRLLVIDPMVTAPDPATADPIFLVPLPGQETNVSAIPSFEIGQVPQAEVDETTGEFVITNIEPGRYIIMILLKGGEKIPARDYETGNLAIVTIDSTNIDQVVELNVLSVP